MNNIEMVHKQQAIVTVLFVELIRLSIKEKKEDEIIIAKKKNFILS